ncbi:class I SAM-dependent methyltransferase [Neobacillus terrae]|uniref:class I SAM-dependent methyltransferase n=1 Tax=Neobacillus terrae TaxID=3034837 RepID=UPI00140DC2EC|nr:class I SAM-dependent methyltransferase [Neobacillus terrae]NHM33767.1 methyltransferase domain-containing protein [Neobacillus terrae]
MDIKKDVKEQFGRNADSYVNSKIHKEGKDLYKLVQIASLNGDERVLDVATGGGHTANAFAPFADKVIAIDLTPEMLKAAKAFVKGNGNSNVEFLAADAEKLPFSPEVYDAVTCRIAPHHFPNIKSFIEETYRVLKPGGQFLLVDNVAPEKDSFDSFYNTIEKKRDYSHFRAWKKSEWLEMLESAGFEIKEFHRFEKIFQYDSWCKRMKLSVEDKMELNQFMLAADKEIKKKFRIQFSGNAVTSFQGESIILKAVKY